MNFSIELSTRNIAEASKIEGHDEFSFIIGKKEVKCHKFVASFLSHPISQNLLSDPTFSSISIKALENIQKDSINELEENVSKTLEHLILGETVNITEEELQKFNEDLKEIRKGWKLTDIIINFKWRFKERRN